MENRITTFSEFVKQVRASLEQAKANADAELARLTKERNVPLGQQRAIVQQAVDESVQAYSARIADIAAPRVSEAL